MLDSRSIPIGLRNGTRQHMDPETLLREIAEYCRRADLAESTFGRLAINDGKLVRRLRDGGRITTDTFDRIQAFMARGAPGEGAVGEGFGEDNRVAGFDGDLDAAAGVVLERDDVRGAVVVRLVAPGNAGETARTGSQRRSIH